ncbi:DUF3179 domain-containing protein [Rhodohalobacter sp. SW132]|uniref:DUF3179 domain-containing protein n=1 Tax=Rhodohalobacter sp. SW132 TaxID=2293433 RepID=UPI0011C06293|nr:DUF3179 domain-containing protein [Rhodohalobacter sp. SW132]
MKQTLRILPLLCLFIAFFAAEVVNSQQIRGFDTDFSQRSIDLGELIDGGPGKDGIPSIDDPMFVSQEEAESWINGVEPVISLEINGEARAYPIQILMWHEIANDELGGVPVAVTFCPLCYSAIVFDRRHDGEVLEFGVSGLLRHSDMIMFDRKTESLWQQFSGEALVGDYTGDFLTIVPSQLISFDQFREAHPNAEVLSRDTGHQRNYGENPYAGYDDINNSPFLLHEEVPDKISPMEKVIGVRTDKQVKGYAYSVTRNKRVLHDSVGDEPIVIFHVYGMASALDDRQIHQSRDDGATGVFSPVLNGEQLEFEFTGGEIKDIQTGSSWSVSGRAVSGPREGEQLETKVYGDYFAFAWLVFYPETEMMD